jgi:hypothetical protein
VAETTCSRKACVVVGLHNLQFKISKRTIWIVGT